MKLCDTCIYGDKYEYDKPCVIYSDHCEMYKKKVVVAEDIWVSLRAVVDVLTKNRVHFCDMIRITSELKELPPVNPQEPKTGHWKSFTHSAYHGIDDDGEPIWREVKVFHCNLCNRRTVIKENYCPNCGAKMAESEDKE